MTILLVKSVYIIPDNLNDIFCSQVKKKLCKESKTGLCELPLLPFQNEVKLLHKTNRKIVTAR